MASPVVAAVAVKVLVPWMNVVPGRLCYDPADPWAVALTMAAPDGTVVWRLSRDLLAAGMHATHLAKAGVGDIKIWRHPSRVRRLLMLWLTSDEGVAVVALDRSTVGRFLGRSFYAVPRGSEGTHIDWDATIAGLLAPRKPSPRPRKGEAL